MRRYSLSLGDSARKILCEVNATYSILHHECRGMSKSSIQRIQNWEIYRAIEISTARISYEIQKTCEEKSTVVPRPHSSVPRRRDIKRNPGSQQRITCLERQELSPHSLRKRNWLLVNQYNSEPIAGPITTTSVSSKLGLIDRVPNQLKISSITRASCTPVNF